MHTGKFRMTGGQAKAIVRHCLLNWDRDKDKDLIDHSKNKDNYNISINDDMNMIVTKTPLDENGKLLTDDIYYPENENVLHQNSLDEAVKEHNEMVEVHNKPIVEYNKNVPKEEKKPLWRKLRKDAPVMGSVILTAPPEMLDTPEHRKQLPQFFTEGFRCVGKQLESNGLDLKRSKITGFVHMNETTPQMHIGVIAVGKDGRIDYKHIFNRTFYKTYHETMSAHLEKTLGRKLSILIEDDTNFNRLLKRAGVSQKQYKKIKDIMKNQLENDCKDLTEDKERLRQVVKGLKEGISTEEFNLKQRGVSSIRRPTIDEETTERNRVDEQIEFLGKRVNALTQTTSNPQHSGEFKESDDSGRLDSRVTKQQQELSLEEWRDKKIDDAVSKKENIRRLGQWGALYKGAKTKADIWLLDNGIIPQKYSFNAVVGHITATYNNKVMPTITNFYETSKQRITTLFDTWFKFDHNRKINRLNRFERGEETQTDRAIARSLNVEKAQPKKSNIRTRDYGRV